MLKWGRLNVSRAELELANVLQAGQAFRWMVDEATGEYVTTMKILDKEQYSVVLVRQHDDNFIECATYDSECSLDDVLSHMKNYFRLEVSVKELYQKEWLPKDSRFKDIETHGIRVLRQEPWETLVSFICSTNNNISRITKMCHALCSNYGDKIGTHNSTDFYSFPTSNSIYDNATEEQLRKLGFGYRAKYIIETAKKIIDDKSEHVAASDSEYLSNIASSSDYFTLREHLMSYTGIGPKVADCIALMGMGRDEVVPVDVHVERIARRDYKINPTNKDVTALREEYKDLPVTRKKVNFQLDVIRMKLNEQWGPYAGWAQGVLFFREVGGTSGANTKGEITKRKHEDIRPKTPEDNDLGIIHSPRRKAPKIKVE